MPGDGSLARYDRRLRSELGCDLLGVDEVGRGCLAGPVVAAAVLLREGARLPGLDDSKKLTPEERTHQARAVRASARAIAVAFVSPRSIDASDIRKASLTAMRRAVHRALVFAAGTSVVVLVDGIDQIPGYGGVQRTIIEGDGTSRSIAGASVIAKTVRDRFMERLGGEYPGYGFERHKGYGTAEHQDAIKRLGVTVHHRRSFRAVQLALGLITEDEEVV